MTITKSPVSTCGVKMVFSFPRSKLAAFTATRPSTWSWASITHHLRGTSVALAEKVFISEKGHEKYGWDNGMSTQGMTHQVNRSFPQLIIAVKQPLAANTAALQL